MKKKSFIKLCKKGPFKSHFESKFLGWVNSLIFRKIKNAKKLKKLVDLNGPFCYTVIRCKVRLRNDC